MRVFVTGATGFVGSAVIQDLIQAGHQVTGLARSDAAAKLLSAAGAKAHAGDLENLESLKSGAAASDGVLHLGFIHDFSRFKEVCQSDRRAIEALASGLQGSHRPLVVTSGTALLKPGSLATENDRAPKANDTYPRASEETADEWITKEVKASAVRLSPSVHGDGDHAFIPILIDLAREKKMSAYVLEGRNRWTGSHRLDCGPLYRLALEKGEAGDRFHGVADEGVPFREIAEMIGKHLGVPVKSLSREEAAKHFTWFTHFASVDCPASSKITQEKLGWKPTHPGLIADIDRPAYYKQPAK